MTVLVRPADEVEESTPEPLIGPIGWRWPSLVFVVHAVVFAPLVLQAVYRPGAWVGPDDYTEHIRWAIPHTFNKPWVPGPPHFVWHSLARLTMIAVPGTDARFGAAVVSIAFAGATGVVWFAVLRRGAPGRRMKPLTAALLSMALLAAEAPAVLSGWQTLFSRRLFMPLWAYHNPTGLAMRPVSALMVLAFLRVADGDRAKWSLRSLAALAVLAALTKPAISVCLLPVVPIVAIRWSGSSAERSARGRRLATWFAIPTLCVVVLQYLIVAYQGGPSDQKIKMVVHPFEVAQYFGGFRPWFWSVLALPILALALWGRALLADRAVELMGWCFLSGLLAFVVFSSNGPDLTGPELLWLVGQPIQLALLFGTRRVGELVRDDPWQARWKLGACGAMGLVYTSAFVVFMSCELGGACPALPAW